MNKNSNLGLYDVVIIGGGFYGSMLALYYAKKKKKVLLLEKETKLITKASYHNQARVHNGYHYPRSFVTAVRSHDNYAQFVRDFNFAVYDKFLMTYAIARINSKVTAQQFFKFCNQIGSKIKPASVNVKKLFNTQLIEEVFEVEEIAFNAAKLRKYLVSELTKAGVAIRYKNEVKLVAKSAKDTVILQLTDGSTIQAKTVFNCTYAEINTILKNSQLPLLSLKHEYTEMPLIKMPTALESFGLTIMDGPFFSAMPFPDKQMHSLHHVRYTPHISWTNDDADNSQINQQLKKNSKFNYMYKDIQRYIPALKDAQYVDSLWQVKTVLIKDEESDRRPIFFKRDYGIKNFHIVMGGKIDNIYDIIGLLDDKTP